MMYTVYIAAISFVKMTFLPTCDMPMMSVVQARNAYTTYGRVVIRR